MADSLNLLSKAAGQRVILASLEPDVARVALAERSPDGRTWSVAREVETPGDGPEALCEALTKLQAGAAVRQIIVASSQCQIVLLNQTVPSHLKPEQAKEMLRWEVEAALDADGAGTGSPTQQGWETGHAGANSHQTAVAAARPAWLESLQTSVGRMGCSIAAVVPTMALGWSCPQTQGPALGSVALAHQQDGQSALSVFERGQLEFFSLYSSAGASWNRSLVADARSFAVKKLLVLGSREGASEPIPGLPDPETLSTGWLWQALLLASGLNEGGSTGIVPVIVRLSVKVSPWSRPTAWWGIAAACILALAVPKVSGWVSQIRDLQRQKESTLQEIRITLEKLQAYEKDAAEYAQLEGDLKTLQAAITQALQDAEKPGRAPCAQLAYITSALQATGKAFASRARVRQFKTDFNGRILIQGESPTDAVVLDALEEFYKKVAAYPVKPAAVTTTKEGAPLGRLLFTADDATSPLATQAAPPKPAASPTSGSATPAASVAPTETAAATAEPAAAPAAPVPPAEQVSAASPAPVSASNQP